jgi:hypothetical protein
VREYLGRDPLAGWCGLHGLFEDPEGVTLPMQEGPNGHIPFGRGSSTEPTQGGARCRIGVPACALIRARRLFFLCALPVCDHHKPGWMAARADRSTETGRIAPAPGC